jgi:hypothetical protein
MRAIRRVAVCIAVGGLLAAGAVGASMEVAHADGEVTSCSGFQQATGTQYECTLQTGTATEITDPSLITIDVNDSTTGYTEAVNINYRVQCTDTTNGTTQTASAPTGNTPVTLNLSLPVSADGTCSVTATITSPSATISTACPAPSADGGANPSPSPSATTCPDNFNATLNYTSNASASPSPTTTSSSSVHPVKGYDGKCVDDNGNSSANRAKVQIWSCSGSDQAENWSFSSNELKHNGKCLNDKADGGNRSKVILYSCNGASNEKWSELANGELKLQAHNGTLCLNDPGNSTKNGTQLIVYTCTGSANEKWSLP